MENTWILKGGRVWSEGRFTESDVAIAKGRVTAIGSGAGAADARTVDCRGCYVLPGLVDVHVHLREPGFTAKETVATGTAAAARGGYTTVCAMPNLNPAPDSPEHLERELEAIRRDARVRVVPYGTITRGQKGRGELIDFGALAPQVAGFSDDGRGVQEEALMREAMLRVKGTGRKIVAHCEADELLRGGYIHDGDYCRAHGHRGISSESEWRQVERDLKLVRETGCPYHVCHVSTRESVELIRAAKAEGLPVSCETAPHYLLLTDADLKEEGRFKMNPPIRSAADRLELLNGLADGTIEAIATDHAPHTAEEKSRGLAGSAMGIVGLECAFPLLYTYLVRRGVISLERLVELMSDNPRRLFGFAPGLAVGEPADVTVFDPERICEIDPETFLSKGRATPFAGWRVSGCTLLTLVGGRAAYQDEKLKLK
ncbi:dihydroorotase [uncultured Alistipes sp.]|uniref:dihydroorotase n=1 Tax=uncultured Alistipes sp. TaxID=538949 RepID=UPI00262F82EB|nr:dihydroorotase [uncultured Alistipes sp.]